MNFKNYIPTTEVTRYSAMSRSLHWLMAFSILCMLALGWGKEFAPSEFSSTMMLCHKTLGFIILFVLVPLRIVARLSYVAPKITGERWAIILAKIVHGLFYLFFLYMPLTGWLLISARDTPYHLGGLTMPSLIPWNREWSSHFSDYHIIGAFILTGLIGLHIGGVLFHSLFKKDPIWKKMI